MRKFMTLGSVSKAPMTQATSGHSQGTFKLSFETLLLWTVDRSLDPLHSERLVIAGAKHQPQPRDVRYQRRIQPVDATHSLNISAGVWKPSVLRGLSFNCRAIALS